jgi:Fe-S cluster assembly ATPase SufC
LNLDVDAGEVLAVTGPNGAGRSGVAVLVVAHHRPALARADRALDLVNARAGGPVAVIAQAGR